MVQHKIYHDNFDYENSFKFLKEANNLKNSLAILLKRPVLI